MSFRMPAKSMSTKLADGGGYIVFYNGKKRGRIFDDGGEWNGRFRWAGTGVGKVHIELEDGYDSPKAVLDQLFNKFKRQTEALGCVWGC